MQIILYGNPISTQNAYWMRGKIKYLKKEARETKEDYIRQAKTQYNWLILENNMLVLIHLYFWDKRRRDWDNWHKISMDALQGIVYKDDTQLDCDGVYRFYDKNNPRIEIWLKDAESVE